MITPETGSNTQGLGGFQETEQLPFFEKITKYQAHCANQMRIPELLSRCFDYAMLERVLRDEPVRSGAFTDEDIRRYNPTATEKFLARFNEPALRQYLDRLDGARLKRWEINSWVRRKPTLRKAG